MQQSLNIFFLVMALAWMPAVFAGLNIEIKKSSDTSLETVGEVNKELTTAAYSIVKLDETTKQFVDIADLIENEAGVQIRKFGAVGSFSTAVLRGSSSQQLVVYLDGVAMNTASIGAIDLSTIDINDIERIEVYRGTTPIELGQASMGGAINIISKKAKDLNSTQFISTLGSFFTQQYTINNYQNYQHHRVFISADYLSSKNNYDIVFDNNTEYTLEDDRKMSVNNDAVKKQSLLIKWDHINQKNSFFDSRLKLYEKKKYIPNKNNSPDVNTFFSTKNIEFFSQYSRNNLMQGDLDFNIKLTSKLISQQFNDSASAIGSFDQDIRYQNKINRIQLFSQYKFNDVVWNVLLAIGNSDYKFNNYLRAEEKSSNQRLDIELNIQQTSYWLDDALILNLALRQQKINDSLDYAIDSFGQPVEQMDKNYQLTQPQIGIKYKLDAVSSIIFNAGRYTRVPVFSELFGNQGLFRGNEELQEETGINIDVGLNYSWFEPYHWYHNAEIYIGAFNNRADNLIVRVYNVQGVSVAKNISGSKVTGIEWNAKLTPNKSWQLNFNATLMTPRVLSNSLETNKKFIPGQYQQVYAFNISYRQKQWRFSAQTSINKDVYWDAPNIRKGNDYKLLNLDFSRKWFKHKFSVQIENVNNEIYTNFDRVWERPGRSVFFNYKYSI